MLYRGDYEGGCFCGAVRYAASDITDAGYCHCSICRRTTGAPVLAWANTPHAGFRLLRGEARFVATSAEFHRAFCADCGTLLWSESIDPARWDQVSMHHGTLDRAAKVKPAVHIFHGDRLPWFEIDDELPRYDEQRHSGSRGARCRVPALECHRADQLLLPPASGAAAGVDQRAADAA